MAAGGEGEREREEGQQGSAGVMTASWAVINLIIVALSWKGKPPANFLKFREFLAFNQGLNLMYIAVGLTLGLAAGPAESVPACRRGPDG